MRYKNITISLYSRHTDTYSMKKLHLILALLLAATTSSYAGEKTVVTSDSVATQIFFRVGVAKYDGKFKNNDANLDLFEKRLDSLHNDPSVEIVRITARAGASPEGPLSLNKQLSRGRVQAIREQLVKRLPYLAGTVTENAVGEDWDGLAARIKSDPNVPAADEALRIITETPVWVFNAKGRVVDSRKAQLQRLAGGRTWRYVYAHFFSDLRRSSVSLVCEITRIVREPDPEPVPAPEPAPEPVIEPAPTPVVEEPAPIVVVEELPPYYWSLRTNMLFDALLLPNIGAEVYVGKNISVDAIWHYGWWKCDHRHNYWRSYGGDMGVRYWFGSAAKRKPLTGHHIGLYGQIVTYDFELGGRGYQGRRWSYAGGFEYGYSKPISRHFNIDFSLGVGYLGGKYYEYIPIDQCYVWQKTKRRNWFGPTKLEISLVWLLGRGNVNSKSTKK